MTIFSAGKPWPSRVKYVACARNCNDPFGRPRCSTNFRDDLLAPFLYPYPILFAVVAVLLAVAQLVEVVCARRGCEHVNIQREHIFHLPSLPSLLALPETQLLC